MASLSKFWLLNSYKNFVVRDNDHIVRSHIRAYPNVIDMLKLISVAKKTILRYPVKRENLLSGNVPGNVPGNKGPEGIFRPKLPVRPQGLHIMYYVFYAFFNIPIVL
jgi:hypothetical protein